MNLLQQAQYLIGNLDQRMSPSIYDIGWVARLAHLIDAPWTQWEDWLLERQYPDGSWGSELFYYHDRIICTLSVMIALRSIGQTPQAQEAFRRAENFLWQNMHLLSHDPSELVGFELAFPTLVDEAQVLGMKIPQHAAGYREIRAAKLKLIPPDLIYSPKVTLVHTLEFLNGDGDPQRMRSAVAPSGALGCSPSATAYYLLLCKGQDERSVAYLRTLYEQRGFFVYLHPFATFELTWALNNLLYSGLHVNDFVECDVLEKLMRAMGPGGAGMADEFFPDADITSVCMRLLADANCPVDPKALVAFEDQEKHLFRTYQYERTHSISTNVHVLDALSIIDDYPAGDVVRLQIIHMLLQERRYGMYWVDKWHISPYYATFHTLAALLREIKDIHTLQPTIDWLIHNQHNTGAWGYFSYHDTAEETAYALQSLLLWKQHGGLVKPDILARGLNWLLAHSNEEYPPMWVGKCLFCPQDVVRAAILSTMISAEQAGLL